MPSARKYAPLTRHLEGLNPAQSSVTLTFAELEQLLGSPHTWPNDGGSPALPILLAKSGRPMPRS
jgi:hypothetical protein